jgi:large subunit ribosomal protein L10
MLKRKEKEAVVENLLEVIKNAKSIVFADYKGLLAEDVASLRKKLFAEKTTYGVYKKSLVQIALNQLKIEADVKTHKGPLALASSQEEEVLPAKSVYEFSQKNENLKITGGILEGHYLSALEMESLAKLPSKEELIARAVGSIRAPISNFVGVLSGTLRSLVTVLKAVEEKKA